MNKVIQFLLGRINFITFLLLEVVCFVMIFSDSPYQGAAFYNSSNQVAGSLLEMSNEVKSYLLLRDVNEALASENAALRNQLIRLTTMQSRMQMPTLEDSVYKRKYSYVSAKVVNNSTKNFRNYLTIDKGWADSIAPGMGVISKEGIVGKVKACSKNYSTITSLLHKEIMISSRLKNSNAAGSIRWDGIDGTVAKLLYIPRHIEVKKGDTVCTSEYNSVFPEGEMIGVVKDIKIKGDENFYNIEVGLSTDFTKLRHVYVIKNRFRAELDSLESASTADKNENK